jgi:hypothetical protein
MIWSCPEASVVHDAQCVLFLVALSSEYCAHPVDCLEFRLTSLVCGL